MRKSKLSRVKQNKLIEHFVAGTTARTVADLVGVNRKTAIYYFHCLRVINSRHLEVEASEFLIGEIEVDEPYFGGILTLDSSWNPPFSDAFKDSFKMIRAFSKTRNWNCFVKDSIQSRLSKKR